MRIEDVSTVEGLGVQVVISIRQIFDESVVLPGMPAWPRLKAAGEQLKSRLDLDPSLELVRVDQKLFQQQYSYELPKLQGSGKPTGVPGMFQDDQGQGQGQDQDQDQDIQGVVG